MVIEGSVGAALLEVSFEPRLSCLMQGDETALAKLCISDD